MKKILFINHEIIPYVPETQVASMGKLVPAAMQEKGMEIRTFMPKWGTINERRGQLHEVIRLSGLNIEIDNLDHQTLIKVASIPQTKIQVYFIDNDDFFMKRGMTLDEDGKPYEDNAERAIFFCRAVVETLKKLRWTPDIIHCQGWMAAFAPFYLKKAYYDEPVVCNAKIVTSVFDKSDIAPIDCETVKRSMEFRDITADSLSDYNDKFTGLDLAKLAIDYSDGIIETSADTDPEVKKFIEASSAKKLVCSSEDFADEYNNFYESLFEE